MGSSPEPSSSEVSQRPQRLRSLRLLCPEQRSPESSAPSPAGSKGLQFCGGCALFCSLHSRQPARFVRTEVRKRWPRFLFIFISGQPAWRQTHGEGSALAPTLGNTGETMVIPQMLA